MSAKVLSIKPLSIGVAVFALSAALPLTGCKSGTRNEGLKSPGGEVNKIITPGRKVAIRRVVCLYDQRPWLNADAQGDRDPEGVWFRVFLDPGTGRGVHAKGTFHVEMYRIDHVDGQMKRELVSDWHYPSEQIASIPEPGMLGEGYVLQLVWAQKATAGAEVEVISRFEDAMGNVVRSGTKRLKVPKYDS